MSLLRKPFLAAAAVIFTAFAAAPAVAAEDTRWKRPTAVLELPSLNPTGTSTVFDFACGKVEAAPPLDRCPGVRLALSEDFAEFSGSLVYDNGDRDEYDAASGFGDYFLRRDACWIHVHVSVISLPKKPDDARQVLRGSSFAEGKKLHGTKDHAWFVAVDKPIKGIDDWTFNAPSAHALAVIMQRGERHNTLKVLITAGLGWDPTSRKPDGDYKRQVRECKKIPLAELLREVRRVAREKITMLDLVREPVQR